MPESDECLVSATLSVVLDSDAPLESRLNHLAALRKDNPALGAELNSAMITRCSHLARAIDELREVNEDLIQLTQRLSSAPVHKRVFLGKEVIEDGRVLARIASGQSELLLSVSDDALLERLQAGDHVYVTADSNAVLGKCDTTVTGPGECAVAERWLPDGRLVVRHHDRELVVRVAAGLSKESMNPGDRVRLDPDIWFAMECMGATPNAECVATEKGLAPEALAGCDDIRDGVLRRITYAVAHPEVAATFGLQAQRPWLLLSGHPAMEKQPSPAS